ncbi:MAG: SDR family NAD(P)-dependent oxidoreductase [Gammaproteobacteria bacterium]|nr:SDR family NAD(P)-dependent oxidoreductase [Gammaproteobacteria bacterium]
MKLSLTLFVALLGAAAVEQVQSAEPSAPKAVLVTGASTGIGRKVTEKLAADGYFVYAAARKDDDLKALGAIKNVQAVRLDVTKPEDIAAAVETIKQGGRGLYGLVNNAGIGTYGTFAEMKPEEFDLVMAVNVYGPYRMTKAFEPLIVAEKGRITNIGSISGILASPSLGAYEMSKHAIEAFTDSLAQQLAELGVTVSVVEPGNYNSAIAKNAVKRGVELKGTSASGRPRTVDRSMYKEPDEVAEAVEAALFEPNPKRRYMVVPDQHEAEVTIRKQIEQLVQLNEGQPYTYDREALVKMLDEALSKARPRTK